MHTPHPHANPNPHAHSHAHPQPHSHPTAHPGPHPTHPTHAAQHNPTDHGHPPHAHAEAPASDASSPFPDLMAEVMSTSDRFAHRQHVHLTYLAVRRYGTAAAIDLVSNGIQGVTRYAGAPHKYNATVSRAWVELVGHHAEHSDAADFDTFAERNAALLDKRLLTRFYRPATLAAAEARTGWVSPDLAPFPWA